MKYKFVLFSPWLLKRPGKGPYRASSEFLGLDKGVQILGFSELEAF